MNNKIYSLVGGIQKFQNMSVVALSEETFSTVTQAQKLFFNN